MLCVKVTCLSPHIFLKGCGTGICGIAAVILGATHVSFSDLNISSMLTDNLDVIPEEIMRSMSYDLISCNWSEQPYPANLLIPRSRIDSSVRRETLEWDTVICSDVLYDEKVHAPLMQILRAIRFKKLLIAYKRRHHEPERTFLATLSTWCCIHIVDNASITPRNLPPGARSGLYILVATPVQTLDS